jgi:putative membrane protein
MEGKDRRLWWSTGGSQTMEPNPSRDGSRPGRARQVLDERYARGELTTEEYRERIEQLR